MLKLDSKWHNGNLQLASWSTASKTLLKKVFFLLREIILRESGAYCMHLKGRGGIKGAARLIQRKLPEYTYVAKFDIKSYYASIEHQILFKELTHLKLDKALLNVIYQYVIIPDSNNNGKGIVAGGALSTLLGTVYLNRVDIAMNILYKKGHIFYIRYVDDILILAKTRWKLKSALKILYITMDKLQLKIHRSKKRFVGRTDMGFDFLGYFFKTNRKIRPSKKSLEKFVQRAKQLMEQGDITKLLFYAENYISYIRSGLQFYVTYKRLKKYIKFIDYRLGTSLAGKINLVYNPCT